MMGFEQALIVASITWLAVISPGADFAVVSRNSSIYGRRAGFASSAGIASGCWIHIAYAIFGISLIIHFVPNLFSIIQMCGAAYLVYIGLTTIFSGEFKDLRKNESFKISNWKHYGTGLLTNSLNPKTSIFVISLYSQVIGTQTSIIEQFLWGAFISLSHLLWFAMIAMFMSTPNIRDWILGHHRLFNSIIGLMLTALGLALFLTDSIEVV